METTPVCIFSRVSTLKQINERQEYELNQYVQTKRYVITHTISTTISGKNPKRPDIDELLALAKSKTFKKVIVTEISRLGRTSKVIRRTIDALHNLGISVIFKNLNLESLDDEGKESMVMNIIIAVFAELAEQEGRNISERTRGSLELLKSKGIKLGRPKNSVENPLIKYPKLVKDVKAGLSLNQCVKLHCVAKNTVVKVKKALAAQINTAA